MASGPHVYIFIFGALPLINHNVIALALNERFELGALVASLTPAVRDKPR